MDTFNADTQMRYAASSLYVVEAATGETVFDQNGRMGLAPASTQKIITAATALDVLGKNYSYQTKFGIIESNIGKHLLITATGDPSLGSWRWEETREAVILDQLKAALQKKDINHLASIIINRANWGDETIPDGWIWQDLGNYYGAACQALNWRENQFDLLLKSGPAIGDTVAVVGTQPFQYDYSIVSQARAAARGTGDNSFLYYPSMGGAQGILTGAIPAGQNAFVVAGSMYNPAHQFAKTLLAHLKGIVSFSDTALGFSTEIPAKVDWVYTHSSPNLSKLVFWFLRKSINLYGEALLKTLALEKAGIASTDEGVEWLQQYWQKKGIDPEALHLYDGSGLSPQNRTTAKAQVAVLQYARGRPWFTEYYEAFPSYNGMKIKSGTINRVKSFSGYHQAKDGKTYVFCFLVNNYSGSANAVVRKMFRVLDALK